VGSEGSIAVENVAIEMLAAFDLAATGTKILNALSVVLGLGLVIFFHELGHFAVAKWCNVHVERFSIGIGPILWSRQKGETEYALSALPFGGYVKMLGQDDMDSNQMTSDEIAENPRAYSAKSVPQRMAIISAGVIMNVLTGFLFFMICYRIGVEEPSPIVGSVVPGFPAWNAGVRSGDRITAINGDEVRSFGDIFNAIVLSSGDIRIQGEHEDGSEFDYTMTPERGAVGRSIGISPSLTPRLSPAIADEGRIAMTGLPAEKASAPFRAGDRLLSIQSQTIESFSQLQRLTARNSSSELTYVFERSAEAPGGTAADGPSGEVSIVVPPAEVKTIGLWMTMGPVKAIRSGSIAAEAGLKIGDRITAVDGLVIGTDYDALQLPNYFAERAGHEVTISVDRQTPATGTEQLSVKLIPDDTPGWTEIPVYQTSPLPIPAIGAAFQVYPRIARVVPGSEADRAGVFRRDQKITMIALEHPDPEKIIPDAFGGEKTPETLNLAEIEARQPGTPEDINWAYAFVAIQQAPNRHVRLYIEDGETTSAHLLQEREAAEGWYTWIRGINGWENAVEKQKAATLGDAVALGVRKTRNTGINIYMTLRSLLRRDLPVDSLSGPLGIVNIGYRVAEKGMTDLLLFLGFLSINLAVINFLPIPVLDGGHMVFLLWEGVSRRKPNAKVIGWAHALGILFIISLFVFVMYLDIFVNKLGTGG
jgi:regulator of sigma E protease